MHSCLMYILCRKCNTHSRILQFGWHSVSSTSVSLYIIHTSIVQIWVERTNWSEFIGSHKHCGTVALTGGSVIVCFCIVCGGLGGAYSVSNALHHDRIASIYADALDNEHCETHRQQAMRFLCGLRGDLLTLTLKHTFT